MPLRFNINVGTQPSWVNNRTCACDRYENILDTLAISGHNSVVPLRFNINVGALTSCAQSSRLFGDRYENILDTLAIAGHC